jgi:hypothetical protein
MEDTINARTSLVNRHKTRYDELRSVGVVSYSGDEGRGAGRHSDVTLDAVIEIEQQYKGAQKDLFTSQNQKDELIAQQGILRKRCMFIYTAIDMVAPKYQSLIAKHHGIVPEYVIDLAVELGVNPSTASYHLENIYEQIATFLTTHPAITRAEYPDFFPPLNNDEVEIMVEDTVND